MKSDRAKLVTAKLLELQQKHKEISDKVQSVLVDTVDFAFGTGRASSIRDAISEIKQEQKRQKQEKDEAKKRK